MPLVLNGTTGVQDNSGAFVAGTAVASTSGTSIDFTGIPSWVKRVTVMFDQVSTNGTSYYQIQLGTSGGIQTTGYNGNWSFNGPSNTGGTATSGFVSYNDTASNTKTGTFVFTLLGNHVWICNGGIAQLGGNPGYNIFTYGSKSLGATLTQVRVTSVNGTDVFDNGTINILYE